MKVIILHHPAGDSLAIVNDTALLLNIDFTEVDSEDSKDIIKGNPALQQDLRAIFADVMAAHGFVIRKD